MKMVFPEKGSSIEIFLGPSGEDQGHFMAEVLELTEKGIVLSGFESGNETSVPPLMTPLRVRFHQRDSGYEFKTIVLHRVEKPYKFCYIAKPVALSRRQLRAYLRIDCEVPLTVIRQDDRRRNVQSGVITNISGGGCVASISNSIPQEVLIEMKFDLEDVGTVDNVVGRILTVRPGDGSAKQHIIQFEAIDDETRTKVIRYTFKKQHIQKKKEADKESESA